MAETRRMQQTLPPDQPALDPERELPPASMRANPRLNDTAEAIGGALGMAARHVNDVRDRFTVIRGGAQGRPASEQIKQAAQASMQDVKQRAGSALEQATARLEDARIKASRLARTARDSAAQRARLVRLRAARLADERPLHVLLGIAGAAFLVGIVLRLGRSKRG